MYLDVVSELLDLISEQVVSSCSAKVLLVWVICMVFLQVQPRLINPLKNLRRLGLKLVAEFFSDYETYSFSVEEIDAVFHAVVWPQVSIFLFFQITCLKCMPSRKLQLYWSPSCQLCPLPDWMWP